jgi:hypothetical protein
LREINPSNYNPFAGISIFSKTNTMRKLPLLLIALIAYANSFSQAFTTTAQYNKIQVPSLQVEIPFPQKTVDKAIEDKMSKLGYNDKSDKDYTLYKEVHLPELGSGTYDLYFESDRKSRGEKDITILTFLISSGYAKFISSTDDPTVTDNAKQFLNNLIATVTAYDLEQQISTQQEIVKKADKKLSGLVSDGEDLVKKKKKIEDEINDNSKDQTDQQAELARQKQILTTLISERK